MRQGVVDFQLQCLQAPSLRRQRTAGRIPSNRNASSGSFPFSFDLSAKGNERRRALLWSRELTRHLGLLGRYKEEASRHGKQQTTPPWSFPPPLAFPRGQGNPRHLRIFQAGEHESHPPPLPPIQRAHTDSAREINHELTRSRVRDPRGQVHDPAALTTPSGLEDSPPIAREHFDRCDCHRQGVSRRAVKDGRPRFGHRSQSSQPLTATRNSTAGLEIPTATSYRPSDTRALKKRVPRREAERVDRRNQRYLFFSRDNYRLPRETSSA